MLTLSMSHAWWYILSEREAQTFSKLINNFDDISYLIDANLPTRLEEVVDIPPASRHCQFRLQK